MTRLRLWSGGYRESLAVPYARMSLIGEFAGAAVVLAAAVIVLAAHRRSRANPLRATIRMYGMTAGQIAVADEIPLGTAKIRIRDGMQRLRAAYLPEDAGGE